MKRLALLAGIAAAGATGVLWAIAPRIAPHKDSAEFPNSSGDADAQAEAKSSSPPTEAGVDQSPDAQATDIGPADRDAALAQYQSRFDFGDDVGAFLEDAELLKEDERHQRARDLVARILVLEDAGDIVGAQSLFLQAAIANAEFEYDEPARDAAIAALQRKYAGATPSTAHLDERYQRYKAREREIVRAVKGRDAFPNGVTREEYLRAELDAALREVYPEGDWRE